MQPSIGGVARGTASKTLGGHGSWRAYTGPLELPIEEGAGNGQVCMSKEPYKIALSYSKETYWYRHTSGMHAKKALPKSFHFLKGTSC